LVLKYLNGRKSKNQKRFIKGAQANDVMTGKQLNDPNWKTSRRVKTVIEVIHDFGGKGDLCA